MAQDKLIALNNDLKNLNKEIIFEDITLIGKKASFWNLAQWWPKSETKSYSGKNKQLFTDIKYINGNLEKINGGEIILTNDGKFSDYKATFKSQQWLTDIEDETKVGTIVGLLKDRRDKHGDYEQIENEIKNQQDFLLNIYEKIKNNAQEKAQILNINELKTINYKVKMLKEDMSTLKKNLQHNEQFNSQYFQAVYPQLDLIGIILSKTKQSLNSIDDISYMSNLFNYLRLYKKLYMSKIEKKNIDYPVKSSITIDANSSFFSLNPDKNLANPEQEKTFIRNSTPANNN